MAVLTGQQIIKNGIVNELKDPEKQVQPCGIDLTVAKIEMYKSEGVIDFDNSLRKLPRLEESGTFQGAWHLTPGAYLITLNEITTIPIDCCGIARPRSSLLRMGVTVHTATWDSGYHGKSQIMLHVINPRGIIIYPNAKILQLMILRLDTIATKGYDGIYMNEGI
jgi:dUTP pyrophosphatase